MTRTRILTETGSEYIITETADGQFSVHGKNVPCSTSRSLGDGEWSIIRPDPWPPLIGEPLFIVSPLVQQPIGSPGRMPGGGKLTSLVLSAKQEEIQ